MASKDKKTAGEHTLALIGAIEKTVKYSIDCCVCGTKYRETFDSYDSELVVAKSAFADGWREGVSVKYGMIGPMCGDCFKTPDNKRGD